MATFPAHRTPRSTTIAKLKALDTQAKTSNVDGFFLGDSIALYGATSLDTGFHAILQDAFYQRVPVDGPVAPYFRYFHSNYAVNVPYPRPFEPERTGVPGQMSPGMGEGIAQQASWQSAGSARWKTAPATSMGAWVKRAKSDDTMKYSVNGVVMDTVSSGALGWSEQRYATPLTGKVDSKGNTIHPTLRVDFVKNMVAFSGIAAYNGTESRGWRFWDGHHSGYNVPQFTSEGPGGSDYWAQQMKVIDPDFVWVSLATNDMGTDETVWLGQYRNLIGLIRRTVRSGVPILLVLLQEPSTAPAGDWDGKRRSVYQVASEVVDTIVFDFSRYISKKSSSNSDEMYDGLHPNDKGYRTMRDEFVLHWTGVREGDYAALLTGGSTGGGDTGGGTGGGTDTTGPVVSQVSPPAGYVVAEGSTVDLVFDIDDTSGNFAVFGDDGRTLGSPTPVGTSTTRWVAKGVPWSAFRPTATRPATVTGWRISARDAAGNPTTGPLRSITVAAPSDSSKPTYSNVSPTAGSTFGDRQTVSISAVSSSGIADVSLWSGGEFVSKLTLKSGTVYEAADLPVSAFRVNSFMITIRGNNGQTISTDEVYFLRAAVDKTPPTGSFMSPVPGTNVIDEFALRLKASDAGSGIASVEFESNLGGEFAVGSDLGDGVWGVDSPGAPIGTTGITAVVTDGNGNVARIGPVPVTTTVSGAQGLAIATVDPTTWLFPEETMAALTALFGGSGSGGGSADLSRLVLDVRSFGAKGDGVTDDTAAVQACLNAAMVAGGATVYFPPGTYSVTSVGVDYSGSAWSAQPESGAPYGYAAPRITGAGVRHSRIVQRAGSTGDVFRIVGKTGTDAGPGNNNKVTGLVLEHLEIEGVSTGGHGIYLRTLVNCTVRNVWVRTPGKSGLYFARETFVSGVDDEYSYANTLREVKVVNAGGWGIEHSGTASIGGSYYDVEAIGCKLGGFKVAPTNLNLYGCQAIGCGLGLLEGRGLLSVRNANTSSVNSALNLVGFRSEGNGMAGSYEVEIQSGIGYAIETPSFYPTTGAHCLGVGLMANGSAGFVQALHVRGGFFGTSPASYPNQKAVVLGSDARDTLVDNPRFQYNGGVTTPDALITDGGFRSSFRFNSNIRELASGPLSFMRVLPAGKTVPARAGEVQAFVQALDDGRPAFFLQFPTGAPVMVGVQPA
jgi:hypothetical protein